MDRTLSWKNVSLFRKTSIVFLILLISLISLALVCLPNTSNVSAYNTINSAKSNYVQVHGGIEKKITDEGTADVIIMFDDSSDNNTGLTVQNSNSNINSNTNINDNGNTNSNTARGIHPKKNSAEVLSNVHGFNKQNDLKIINGYSGTLTAQGLQELKDQAQQNGINIRVYEDRNFNVLNSNDNTYGSSDATYIPPTSIDSNSTNSDIHPLFSEMDLTTAIVGANYSWDVLNITGRNITIAVIDSGIDYTHTALGGCYGNNTNESCKIFGGYNFVDNSNDPMDDFPHGTLVAGIISANGDGVKGVAPDSKLLALKVCDSSTHKCPESKIISAIEWVRDNSNAQIMSLSLGGHVSDGENGNNGKNPLSLAIENITMTKNIVVVVSAGNEGPGVSSINSPADAEHAITVGSINDEETYTVTDDVVAGDSSRGPSAFGRLDPEIVAPGVMVKSTTLSNSFAYDSGTSYSAPFVTGGAALLLEQNPLLTPLEVRAILIQSTNIVNGLVFERGTGELNMQNALTGKTFALINSTDPYGRNVINDRWEFVITPYKTSYANLTVINHNNYPITFNVLLENITNLENDVQLSTAQLGINSSITVQGNSNYTLPINFTLNNFSNDYATTYGGIIFLNGSGNNGTANVAKTLRIPIVITIPILNYGYISRAMYNPPLGLGQYTHEDVYYYCYYNNYSRNTNVSLNWSNNAYDLDLYLYNSTGDIDVLSNVNNIAQGTSYEQVSTAKTDSFKWIRIDGFYFSSPPIIFNLNVTELGNHAPIITSIVPINGSVNDTNTFSYHRPSDIIFNVSYYDADNDALILTVNDSSYVLFAQTAIDASSGYAVFKRNYSSSIPKNHTILINAKDPYGADFNLTLTVLMFGAISLNSYSPTGSLLYVGQNGSIDFTVDASETNNNTLYYYWSVNGTVNATTGNYTFNASNYLPSHYVVRLAVYNNATNNDTNETQLWDVYIDSAAPVINVSSPINAVYNQSKIDINYTVNDTSITLMFGSGVSSCWYSIGVWNNTGNITYTNNISLISCANTKEYLSNGNYSLIIYSNDSVGNTGYVITNFSINDAASPNILSTAPVGTLAHTSSVVLSVSTDEYSTCKYDTNDVSYDSMGSNFSNNITEHSASYPVDTGSYNIYVRCTDLSGNTNNFSTSIGFTISASPPSGGGTKGSSGKTSGGSSGGGNYNPGFNSNLNSYSSSVSKTFDSLPAGETSVSINNSDIPFSQIDVYSEYNLSKVLMNIIRTDTPELYYGYYFDMNDTNSSNVEQISAEEYWAMEKYYAEEKYAYVIMNISFDSNNLMQKLNMNSEKLNITSANLDVNDIFNTTIYFSVTNKWIEDNNISKDDIVLLKYNEGNHTWEEIHAELLNNMDNSVNNLVNNRVNSSGNFSYYMATGNGFGLYSISYNKINGKSNNGSKLPAERIQIPVNKSTDENNIPRLHSEEMPKSGFNALDGLNNAFNALKSSLISNSSDWSWIIMLLFCTFIFVLTAMIIIRHQSTKAYENQMIKSTQKEFKDANNELAKKVPDLSKKLPDFRENTSLQDRGYSESKSAVSSSLKRRYQTKNPKQSES